MLQYTIDKRENGVGHSHHGLLVVVAHTILVVIDHLLKDQALYQKLGAAYHE